MNLNRPEISKKFVINFSLVMVLCLLIIPVTTIFASAQTPTADTMIVSTEVIDYYGMSSTEIVKLVGIFAQQKIPEITLRLNAFGEFSGEQPNPTGVATAKKILAEAAKSGIRVNIDLHTWYTTWDNYFRDSAASSVSNRAKYLNYVRNSIAAFSGCDVATWMVFNEPQARKATTSENQFLLDVIAAAKSVTSKPVSGRFMGGYSPDTGHYSSSIDSACDFLCRNVYWDPRNPSRTVYGVSNSVMDNMISNAINMEKQLWITEFGKSKSDLSDQANYIMTFVGYGRNKGIGKVFAWVSKPMDGASETYNIFGENLVPNPAFYELKNIEQAPQPEPQPEPEPAPAPSPVPAPEPSPVPAPEPSPVPAPSTLIFGDNFDSGSLVRWTGITATSGESISLSKNLPYAGVSNSMFTSDGQGGVQNAYVYKSVNDEDEIYVRGYFYISRGLSLRDNSDRLYFLRLRANGQSLAAAGIRRDGNVDKWMIYASDGRNLVGPSYAVKPSVTGGRWYCVELHWKRSSNQGLVELYVDGQKVLQLTRINTGQFGNVDEIDFGLVSVTNVQNKLTLYGDSFISSSKYIGTASKS